MGPGDAELAYAAQLKMEQVRNVQLRADLTRIESIARLMVVDESPRDVLPMPKPGDRKSSQEVYVGQSGGDSLFTGLSKRTPVGSFFAA
mmetsp:Transcript_36346/g.84306  ORF Transcript_36346/g.84306 Transcript_36346/m.84306 type:complete len:89 (+) Transcript_36346:168-434(+)